MENCCLCDHKGASVQDLEIHINECHSEIFKKVEEVVKKEENDDIDIVEDDNASEETSDFIIK